MLSTCDYSQVVDLRWTKKFAWAYQDTIRRLGSPRGRFAQHCWRWLRSCRRMVKAPSVHSTTLQRSGGCWPRSLWTGVALSAAILQATWPLRKRPNHSPQRRVSWSVRSRSKLRMQHKLQQVKWGKLNLYDIFRLAHIKWIVIFLYL